MLFNCRCLLLKNIYVFDCVSPGYPDAGPQAKSRFRSRGPGPEEPAAGEGEDAALTGGNHSIDRAFDELKSKTALRLQ